MHINPTTDRDLIAMFTGTTFTGPERKRDANGCLIAAQPARRERRIRQHPGLRLLQAVMELAGPDAELVSHTETPWASVTFSGTRHTILLSFNGITGIIAANALIETLPEHEFAIPRQLVADAAITSVVHDMLPSERIVIEAELLLLEDC